MFCSGLQNRKGATMTETPEDAMRRVYAHLSHMLDLAIVGRKIAEDSFAATPLSNPLAQAYLDRILDYSGEIRAYQMAISELTRQNKQIENSRKGI